jgi:hypothetical protein
LDVLQIGEFLHGGNGHGRCRCAHFMTGDVGFKLAFAMKTLR